MILEEDDQEEEEDEEVEEKKEAEDEKPRTPAAYLESACSRCASLILVS